MGTRGEFNGASARRAGERLTSCQNKTLILSMASEPAIKIPSEAALDLGRFHKSLSQQKIRVRCSSQIRSTFWFLKNTPRYETN